MFNPDGGFQQNLGMSPELAAPNQSSVTRFAGQALAGTQDQPLEVTFGSKKDLKNPDMRLMRDRSQIQSNTRSGAQGLKDNKSIRSNISAGGLRDRGSIKGNLDANLKDRRSIQGNQGIGGHLTPTTLEGFDV